MANQATLQEALGQMGFEKLGLVQFGTWQGYAVTVYPNQNFQCVEFAVRADKKDNQLRKTLLAAMKERLQKKCRGCVNKGNSILFNMVFSRKESYQQQLTDCLNAAANALRAAGVQPASTCAHCGGAHPDSLCLVDSFQPVHAACVRNAKEETVEKAQQNEESGSYLTGIIGAVIGTLVGIVPSVLTVMLTEKIYALLFALVPLAAMFGYRLFKGKQSKASIGIIIVLSVIGVIVLQLAVATISVAQEYELGIAETASEVVPYFLSGDGIGELLSNSVMEFLFMALGIAVAWKYLAQTNAGKVATAEAVASTLRPINTDAETTQV